MLPCVALGQHGADELSGVATVGFLVEDLRGGAARCGVTKAALETAARRVIRRTALQVGALKESDGYLYINANVIYAPPFDYCAFSVGLRFNTYGDATTRYGGGYFAMTLFDQAAVGMFRRERTPAEIGVVVEQLAGRFVEAWLHANTAHVIPGSAPDPRPL